MKSLIILFITLLFLSCENEKSNSDEPITQNKNSNSDNANNINQISDFKVNNEVSKKEEISNFIEAENKEFVSPKRLFDFYPTKFYGLELQKNSSGNTSSGLGRYTTSTGVFKKEKGFIRIRLSDYYGTEFFPDFKYMENTPSDNVNFTFEKVYITEGVQGYLQWHRTLDEGTVNIFLYNRFNIFIEIGGLPKMKNDYKNLISKFKLQQLKEISENE